MQRDFRDSLCPIPVPNPPMRNRLILLFALLAWAFPAAAQNKIAGGGAVITEFRGTVVIQVGTEPARQFKPGQPLPPGTLVRTGMGSSAVLVFPDGQICVLGEDGAFRVIEYRYDPKDAARSSVSINLIDGSMRLVMGEIGRLNPSAVRIQIGVATLAPLPSQDARGTDASVVVQGGPAAVTVQEGRVAVMLPAGPQQQIGAGQGLYIGQDGTVRRGDTAQILQFLGQVSQGAEMQKQLAELQRFGPKITQTVITLATVTSTIKDPASAETATAEQVAAAEILKQLDSLPAPGSTAPPAPAPSSSGGGGGTPSTGGGGGGTPCSASCN